MLATPAAAPLVDEQWVYEPKYVGIRALASIEPGAGRADVRIWSRGGNDKTAQFPEIVAVLADFGRRLKAPVLVDGEIVALGERGQPAGFQRLQSRLHLTAAAAAVVARRRSAPVALVVFDILRDGATADAGVSTPLTWREVDAGVDRADFTIRTLLDRVRAVGDRWAALRRSPGADLEAVLRATA